MKHTLTILVLCAAFSLSAQIQFDQLPELDSIGNDDPLLTQRGGSFMQVKASTLKAWVNEGISASSPDSAVFVTTTRLADTTAVLRAAFLNGGNASLVYPYVMSSSTPSDTALVWIDSTNQIYLDYPVKEYFNGQWSEVMRYNVLLDEFRTQKPEVWGLEGQSNAIGGSGSNGGDRTQDSLVQAWNGTEWVIADLDVAPFRGSAYNNYAFHAARARARETGRVQRIVIEAAAGIPISNYVPQTAARYVDFENKVIDSGTAAEGGIDFWTFFQGEADRDRSILDYKADCDTLAANLRAETWFGEEVPMVWVAMYDGPNSTVRRKLAQVHRLWANDNDPYSYTALTGDLSMADDWFHLDAAGLKQLGHRVANIIAGRPTSWYKVEFRDTNTINAMYELDQHFYLEKEDTAAVTLNFYYGKDGAEYTFINRLADTTDISFSGKQLVNANGDAITAWSATTGVYDFYHYRDTLFSYSNLIGSTGSGGGGGGPSLGTDTMSFATTVPINLSNTSAGVWVSTTTSSWSGYGMWDQYSPAGEESRILIDVPTSFEANVMLGFNTEEVRSKWNETNPWEYGVYWASNSLIRIENGSTTSFGDDLDFNGNEKLALARKSNGDVTIDIYNGTSWSTYYTFSTSNSGNLYFNLSVRNNTDGRALNPSCEGCENR